MSRIRLDYLNGRVKPTKTLIVKAVDLLFQDTSFTIRMSKRELIEWFYKNLKIKFAFKHSNRYHYFEVWTDPWSVEQVVYDEESEKFYSNLDFDEPLSEFALVGLFKTVLEKSEVVFKNERADDFV